MDETFEVDSSPPLTQAAFDSVRARFLFEADVFWARASIGEDVLAIWLESYQTSRTFQKLGIVELEFP